MRVIVQGEERNYIIQGEKFKDPKNWWGVS